MSDVEGIVKDVWSDKYRYWLPDGSTDEHSRRDTLERAVRGVHAKDENGVALAAAIDAVCGLYFSGAGRIIAGAGTDKRVTLMNCYVNAKIEDSMRSEEGVGIMDALNVAAYTQQMGGGIGTGFSTIRPNGAIVKRTGSVSSGILPFMDMWHSMCGTIMSSGSRRGAMMATLACDHPDLWNENQYEVRPDGKLASPSFITAKQEPGRITNFNVSVLISDAFMEAVQYDKDWDLGFRIPRGDGEHVDVYEKNGEPWYVYRRVKARTIWNDIIRNTYEHAEPGVIFVDRVNEKNNLRYCEIIDATNPCGEQPLPPYGDCCLGFINLAKLVVDPFGAEPHVDIDLLRKIAAIGVRFLDNTLDVSQYPVDEMYEEAMAKRRIGLGITGLGNMLQMLKLRYGSPEACEMVEKVMWHIADATYHASAMLAKERGSFPLYDKEKFAESHYLAQLSEETRTAVAHYGIRNGVLLTVAPVGTMSIFFDNVSGGIEPTFAWHYERDVLQPDGTKRPYEVRDYGYDLWKQMHPDWVDDAMPDYMVSATELTVMEHLNILAVVQKFIDASVSKTINCPEKMPFEEFMGVYEQAFDLGLKGCTTYRPSKTRGSVLRVIEQKKEEAAVLDKLPRQEIMAGNTYKMPWALTETSFYITINNIELNGQTRPFEIFINSKSAMHDEWAKALTRLISAVFRRGVGDVTFLVKELEAIHSAQAGTYIKGVYVPSIPALIGHTLRKHFVGLGLMEDRPEAKRTSKDAKTPELDVVVQDAELCPKCSAKALIHQEGCDKCTSCGYSSCG